jgi:L-iditol 2-dehydrogenase
MKARALICSDKQNFSLEEVILKDPAPGQVVIRTHWSGVSVGTEFALIRNKISWGPYPLCTGYMGTGVIETVGEAVEGFAPGDAVYFRANDAMNLSDGSTVSCVTGAHCSMIVTRPGGSHGIAKMVPGAAMDTAAMFVLPAVGLNGVDTANPRMGETVVVYGVGLIGLGVVAACVNRGCTVIAVDLDERQLGMAEILGADHRINGRTGDVVSAIQSLAPGGADVVFECTGLSICIDAAIALCREQGRFVWQGNYGAQPVSMQFLPAHGRRLQMFFPCDDGGPACRRAVVKQMAMGRLPWEETITHRVSCPEAQALYHSILEDGLSGTVGAIINWQEEPHE